MAYNDLLSDLPDILVAAGLLLLLTSLTLNWRARRHLHRLKKLLALAHREIEPLELPAAAWPLLLDSQWKHLSWQGHWFGQPVTGECGLRSIHAIRTTRSILSNPFIRSIRIPHPSPSPSLHIPIHAGDDAYLQLELTHAAPGSESHILAEQLARVFALLLESRMRARTEALSAALAARASLSLYLQHDMRNLAQWVTWVSADFTEASTPESLLDAAHRLHANAPLAHERAARLMTALGQHVPPESPMSIDIRQAMTQAAQMAGIAPLIEGDAQIWIAPNLLNRALDNLFSNMATLWRNTPTVQPSIQISTLEIAPQTLCEIQFHCPCPEQTPSMTAEKLFEPFTSGRPGGLGLGLYQARKSVMEGGGSLTAQAEIADVSRHNNIRFTLRLPVARQTPPDPMGSKS